MTKGVTRAIYRVSQRRQRGSARVSGCQSLRMCTNDIGNTPFLSGSPSMCPIWKQKRGKMTHVRKERGRGAAFQGVPGGVPGGGTGKTHPPLLVLFSCNYDHLSFDKSQLVVVVGLAVVDGLHPAGFGLPLETQKSLRNKRVSKASGAAALTSNWD